MSTKELLTRIAGLTRPYRWRLIFAMLSMILVAALSSTQAYMVKPLLDEIFVKEDRQMLNILPPLLVLLFLAKGCFYYSYSYLLENAGHSVIKDLRYRLYSHIQALPLSFFHRTPTGELISRILSDVTLIQTAVSSALVGVLKDFFQVIGLLGVIFYLDWKLALMSIIFLPLAAYPITKFGQRFRKYSTQNQQTLGGLTNVLHETIGSGNRIVKAFCMEEHEKKRFAKVLERLFGITMKEVQVKSFAHPTMELLGGVGIAFIIWYGGHQVLKGASTPGTFFSFLTSLIMIYEPIKGVSKINNPVQQGIAAAIRVFSLLDTKTDIVEKPGAAVLPPVRHRLTFENVSFSYDGESRALTNINLEVQAGEILAIVGPSGGGKTTLVNLIPRFYDVSSGRILIDDHDIRDVTLQSLRRQIAIVSQQTILFNDTIRHNIAYGKPDSSELEIIAAAKAAHAYGFIMEMEKGFDTVIGESGSRLSGGQSQRLSIARALLKDSPILILDEATSALDMESEREVQRALENLMKNRTTFVIAHRLSTIRNADRIVVIQNGRIIEKGRHDQLLERDGMYRTMHNMQHAGGR